MKLILFLIGTLSILWIFLLWLGLPKFRKKLIFLLSFFACLFIGSRLLRLYPPSWHFWNSFIQTKTYYYFIVLPTTIFLITMLLSLGISPLWFISGRLAQRVKKNRTSEPLLHSSEQHVSTSQATENSSTHQKDHSQEQTIFQEESSITFSRRQILSVLSWAGPGAALFTASYGVAIEAQRITIRRLKLSFPHLPTSLQGFRIGQITDSHISHDFTLIQSLEYACELLSKENLDLLVTTGDLCDHRPQFGAVTKILSQVPTRFGHYACLGNHELHVGLRQVRKAHEQSSLHLLENEHIQIGDLTLAGIHYPTRGVPNLGAETPLFSEFLQKALPADQANPFTLLLSNHPHVIEQIPAHATQIDLVLSGHMHGGQIGLGDRSFIEPLLKYTRGLYQTKNQFETNTQLFVSNGMGHWLPFRFLCPPEVVVIELTKQV